MAAEINERDFILLNAYLDEELSAGERRQLEARLEKEEHLQQELRGLRATKAVLGLTERVRAPRNFTLDPAVYGRPEPLPLWERLGLPSLRTLAPAAAAAVAVLMCVAGGVLMRPLGGGSVAMAPLPEQMAVTTEMEAQGDAAAEEAVEAPVEEAAPAEGAEPFAAEEEAAVDEEEAAEEMLEEEASEADMAEAPAPEPTPTARDESDDDTVEGDSGEPSGGGGEGEAGIAAAPEEEEADGAGDNTALTEGERSTEPTESTESAPSTSQGETETRPFRVPVRLLAPILLVSGTLLLISTGLWLLIRRRRA